MDVEQLRKFCLSLPHVTEDVKWQQDLCFLIGNKMFSVTGLGSESFGLSLKVREDEFDELIASQDIIPAPYLARYKWIYIQNANRFSKKEWEHYIRQSYELVKSALPKKILKSFQFPV